MSVRMTPRHQRGLAYGMLLGCVAALAGVLPASHRAGSPGSATTDARFGTPAGSPSTPSPAMSYGGTFAQMWQMVQIPGSPAGLKAAVTLSSRSLPLDQALAQIARASGLNLVCYQTGAQRRLFLQITRAPAWMAMGAVAIAAGGHWEQAGSVFVLHIDRER